MSGERRLALSGERRLALSGERRLALSGERRPDHEEEAVVVAEAIGHPLALSQSWGSDGAG